MEAPSVKVEADELASALLTRRGNFSMTVFSKKYINSTSDRSVTNLLREQAALNLK